MTVSDVTIDLSDHSRDDSVVVEQMPIETEVVIDTLENYEHIEDMSRVQDLTVSPCPVVIVRAPGVPGISTCPSPGTPGGDPSHPKLSGSTAVMTATPVQGVAPYTLEFRRIPFQSMTDLGDITAITIDTITELIPNAKLTGGTNTATGVTEGTAVTRTYAIGSDDINGATTKSGDTGPTMILASKIIDSCSSQQSCISACKLYVGCATPICDFTVS